MKKYLAVILAAVVGCFCLSTAMGQGYGGMSGAATKPSGSPGVKTAGSASESANVKKPGTVLTGGAIVATPVTKEEAAKKYPLPAGKNYPAGDRDIHKPSGWVNSPYSRDVYDCSNIARGGLVLDTHVNKLFTRP
jgi:hypothetical protein